MKSKISNETWQQAQINERKQHVDPFEKGQSSYFHAYQQYFQHIGLFFNLEGKSIIEIGPADHPALGFCKNYSKSYVIEPMPSSHLARILSDKNIELIKKPAENYKFPKVNEVWLFNVLQHVIDPDVIIEKSKEAADIIRFFEPINMGRDKCHLHSFNAKYFKDYFGDCVKIYPYNPSAVGFHTHECAYGVFEC